MRITKIAFFTIFLIFTGIVLHSQEMDSIPISSIDWSPDSTMIAFGGGSSTCATEPTEEFAVRVLDASTQEVLFSFQGHKCRVTSLAWSPDGTKLASSSIDGTAKVWSLGAQQLLATTVTPTIGRGELSWNPDGTLIANVWLNHFMLEIWDAATGQTVRMLEDPDDDNIFSTAWSPDGTMLATANDSDLIHIWNPVTGELLFSLSGHGDLISALAWNPDSTEIASGSYDGSVRIWNARTGEELHIFSGQARQLVWSPDAYMLAGAMKDNTVHIWNTTTGQEVDVIQSGIEDLWDIAWSPDAQQLAYAGDNGLRGKNLQILPMPTFCTATSTPTQSCELATATPMG